MLCQIGAIDQVHLSDANAEWLYDNADKDEDFVQIADGDFSRPMSLHREVIPAAEVIAGEWQDEWICFSNTHSQADALKGRAAEVQKGFWGNETTILIDDDYTMD